MAIVESRPAPARRAPGFHMLPFSRRRGPWPQPSPVLPGKLPPAVLHMPADEVADWARHIGLGYMKSLVPGIPEAVRFAFRGPYPRLRTDEEICWLLFDTTMSRHLCDTLDPPDLATFAPLLADRRDGDVFYKADFSNFDKLALTPGFYAAPSISLFRSREGKPQLLGIWMNGLLLTPTDGEAWTLAKVFVAQALSLYTFVFRHVPLHFPFDTVNAVTKTVLPKDHLLSRLFKPHFRYTLPLNDAALHSPFTVLSARRELPYTPMGNDAPSVYRFFSDAFTGIPGNSAFPPFVFPRRPAPVIADFGVFLMAYFEVMHRFTRKLVTRLLRDDPYVRVWADHIHQWQPGFPDGKEILDYELLSSVLATILWDTTVGHAADHYGYGVIPLDLVPMRVRLPPPASKRIPPFDRSKLATREDAFRHRLSWNLFIRVRLQTRLMDVEYDFDSPELLDAAAAFQLELRELDAHLPTRCYIPLEQISASIQF